MPWWCLGSGALSLKACDAMEVRQTERRNITCGVALLTPEARIRSRELRAWRFGWRLTFAILKSQINKNGF